MAVAVVSPNPPIAGQPVQVSYSFGRDKSGGAVAIVRSPQSIFVVETQCGTPNTSGPNRFGQCAPANAQWYLDQLGGALSAAGIVGASGQVVLTAPAAAGSYGLVTVYQPDGGTIDAVPLQVVAPPPPPAPATQPNGLPAGANPADYGFNIQAIDGTTLGQQTPFVQNVYVITFGRDAGRHWVDQHNAELGAAAPGSPPTAPVVTPSPPAAPSAPAPAPAPTPAAPPTTTAPAPSPGDGGTLPAPSVQPAPAPAGAAPSPDLGGAIGQIGQTLGTPVPILGQQVPVWGVAVGAYVLLSLFSNSGGRRRRF